ncbi:hypothetical protein D3C87_1377720 [compost metagenome]
MQQETHRRSSAEHDLALNLRVLAKYKESKKDQKTIFQQSLAYCHQKSVATLKPAFAETPL